MTAGGGNTARRAEDILKTMVRYETFRGRQTEIVETVAGGGDALLRPGVGVIVSPLIALMANELAALHHADVAAASLTRVLNRANSGPSNGGCSPASWILYTSLRNGFCKGVAWNCWIAARSPCL